MNRRAAYFEIGSITALLLIGITLASLSIDSTGILSVAALLSLFFMTSHYKVMLGLAVRRSPGRAWSAAPTSAGNES